METFDIPSEFADKFRELGFGLGGFLTPYEIIFLNEKGIASIYSDKVDNFKRKYGNYYRVYKYLRERGYLIRPMPVEGMFRIYRKGYRPDEDRTVYVLRVVNDFDEIGSCLAEDLELSLAMRKGLVYAVLNPELFFVEVSKKSFP